jgi:DUF1365 family protein
MRSHLLVGSVRHRRPRPTSYGFTHGVYYLALDVDEIEEVEARIRPFGYNRRNVFALRDDDHFAGPDASIALAVHARLERLGLPADELRTTLVTNPRVLGYVFNPVSFYLSHDAAGTLRHVIAEVHNTHGEQEVYDLAPDEPGARTFRAEADKRMYVSPFIAMDARYRFRCVDSGDRLSLGISEFEGEQRVLHAALALRREPLTHANLARAFARYPLITLQTIGLIHWHGLRLWLRRVPFRRHVPREAARR